MSGEQRKRIHLSTDILIDVFHYCSRKDLALRVSLTNFYFWHSSKNVPTLHFVHGIKFYSDVVFAEFMGFRWIQKTLSFTDLTIPEPFVRFQNVSIRSCHHELLPSFLESSKQSFMGSKLNIEHFCNTFEESESVLAQTINVLNANLLDMCSIRFEGIRICPYRLLDTIDVLNCDKVTMVGVDFTYYMHLAFMDWLHWKKGQENSRRHLIFERCPLTYSVVLRLQDAFLTATCPVNYMVSFVQCMDYIPSLISDMEFSLENKETGERLTMFKYPEEQNRKMTFRIWRRIPIEDDNQKHLDAEHLSMLSGECAANDSFDKDFYDF